MRREPTHRAQELVLPGDLALAELARQQHGVVSAAQLRAFGLSDSGIRGRVARGRLHRVHRGVYAVGHSRLTVRGHVWAAILACGGVECAALSHWWAAAAWDLCRWPTGAIDVVSLGRSDPRAGIRVHKSRTLDPDLDIVEGPDGFPVTTAARTHIDLADVATPHRLERLMHRAEVLGLLDAAKLTPPPGRRSRAISNALASLTLAEPLITENDVEEAFLAIVADAGLPRPRTQVWLLDQRYRADFFWPDQALVVEVDGRGAHLRPTAFEDDRRRDAELLLAGFRVIRFTTRQLALEPGYVAATLDGVLTRR